MGNFQNLKEHIKYQCREVLEELTSLATVYLWEVKKERHNLRLQVWRFQNLRCHQQPRNLEKTAWRKKMKLISDLSRISLEDKGFKLTW